MLVERQSVVLVIDRNIDTAVARDVTLAHSILTVVVRTELVDKGLVGAEDDPIVRVYANDERATRVRANGDGRLALETAAA